jgi:hypothetical protein
VDEGGSLAVGDGKIAICYKYNSLYNPLQARSRPDTMLDKIRYTKAAIFDVSLLFSHTSLTCVCCISLPKKSPKEKNVVFNEVSIRNSVTWF